MLVDRIGAESPSVQSSRPQFISVPERKALVSKAVELQKAKVIKALHVDVLRYFFFRCPGAFTGEWRPALATIAAQCGVSVSTVVRALSDLRSLGLVGWTRQRVVAGGRSLSTPNRYFFPAEFLKLGHEALLRLARLARVRVFDWSRQQRDRQKAARSALPVAPPPRPPAAAVPPAPMKFSAGLTAMLEGFAR